MDEKPKLNLRQFAPQKAGKGTLIRTAIYFIALLILVFAIYSVLSRTAKKPAPQKPGVIENIRIELEQN